MVIWELELIDIYKILHVIEQCPLSSHLQEGSTISTTINSKEYGEVLMNTTKKSCSREYHSARNHGMTISGNYKIFIL
jgi:hypothetical protein